MTKYLVLERIGGLSEVERYATLGQAEAHGPMQAIKAVTASRDLPEGDLQEFFVAVPVRNWTAVSKSVKRQEPVVSYVELPTLDGTPQTAEVEVEPEPEPAAADEEEPGLVLVDPDADDAEPEDDEPAAATA